MKRLLPVFSFALLLTSTVLGQQYYVQPTLGTQAGYPQYSTAQPISYSQPNVSYGQPISYAQPMYAQPAIYSQPVSYAQPMVYQSAAPVSSTPVSNVTYATSSPAITSGSSIPVTTASYSTAVPTAAPAVYSTPAMPLNASPVYAPASYQQPVQIYRQQPMQTYQQQPNYSMGGSYGSGLAQQKAQMAANRGMRAQHVGGGFAGGQSEGVGFSTMSPESAIRASCYWGTRPVHQIGVARGRDGWYATVIYR